MRRDIRPRAAECIPAAELHDEKWQADGDDLGSMRLHGDVAWIQRQTGGSDLSRHDASARQGLRRAQLRTDGGAMLAQQRQRHQTRALLEQENSAG